MKELISLFKKSKITLIGLPNELEKDKSILHSNEIVKIDLSLINLSFSFPIYYRDIRIEQILENDYNIINNPIFAIDYIENKYLLHLMDNIYEYNGNLLIINNNYININNIVTNRCSLVGNLVRDNNQIYFDIIKDREGINRKILINDNN